MGLVGTFSINVAPQLLMAATSGATPLNPYQHPHTTEPIRLWGFPGQGIQQVGMGSDLYESSSAFREIVDRGSATLGGEGVDLRGLMFEGPQDQLTRTPPCPTGHSDGQRRSPSFFARGGRTCHLSKGLDGRT